MTDVRARVDAALGAISERDPDLRAFLSVDAEGAHAAADAAQRRLDAGERSALLGASLALKDAYTTAVPRTTYGTRATPAGMAGGDCEAARRLRAAGAAIVGKTNMSELCIGEYVLRGAPRPPLTPDRTPGASSGGCAVAVAAGLVDASVGTDTGGSVRTPAAYCGVVGFKPSHGAIPLEGAVALAPSLDHGGVLARSVAVAAAVAEALTGRPMREAAAPQRVLVTPAAGTANPDVAAALERVARAVPPAGTEMAAGPSAPFAGWREVFAVLMPAEAFAVHAALLDDDRLGASARVTYATGAAIAPAEVEQAQRARAALARRTAAMLAGGAVLITPAVDGVAPHTLPARWSEGFWSEMDWHAPANLTGGPAVTVPVGGPRPPVALQVLGMPGDDRAVLATAMWLEVLLAGGVNRRSARSPR